MNLAEIIYQKSLDLPEDKAAEVIDFIDFIKSRSTGEAHKSTAVEPVPNEKTAALLKQSKEDYQSFADTESLFSHLDD